MSAEPVVLAIESASGSVGCAIGGVEGVLASTRSVRDRRHAESLAPQIEFVVGQAGITLRDLTAVAVDVGPGLYTGLRVGITTGLALAHALGVGMVEVGSLETLARQARAHVGSVHAIIDARRGEVFHAAYRGTGAQVEQESEPQVVDPAVLASSLAGVRGLVLVGDGVAAHADAFADIEALRLDADADPEDVLALAVDAALAGRVVEPARVQPRYLREPDAVAKWGAAS